MSEVIKKKWAQEKNNDSFTYGPKSPYQVGFDEMDRNLKQNGIEGWFVRVN